MKWFSRSVYRPVNGIEHEDEVEVDRISFTSSKSSGEERDDYPGNATRPDLINFEENAEQNGTRESTLLSEPSVSPTGPMFSEFFPDQPTTSSEVFRESCLVRNSIFWFDDNEVDATKLKRPLSNRGRVCRFDNDVDDTQLETLSRSVQIAMGLSERSRWLNMISKDPVMSAIAREIDPDFPIAMMSEEPVINEENVAVRDKSLSVGSADSGQTIARIASSSTGSQNSEASETSARKRMVRIVVPARKGIEAIEIRRKVNETNTSICSEILKQSIKNEKPRDRRMEVWMREYSSAENWMSEVEPASRKHDSYSSNVPSLAEDWVLHVHKQPPIRQGMVSQEWKCAACRQSMHAVNLSDKESAPKFCEYYGLYFCNLCHGGEKSIIPSRVINLWNFNEVPVSDRAIRFLRAVRELPVFRLRELSSDLMKKNKSLRNVIELRMKLKHMEQFIKLCDYASRQVTEYGNLATIFASLDRYLLESDDLFSLNDMLRVYNRDLIVLLEPLAKNARNHILKCERCSQNAHVCVKCNDVSDRLFPFEEKVHRCDACGALSHAPKCPRRDVPKDSTCPKCLRILKTRSRQRILAVGTVGDV